MGGGGPRNVKSRRRDGDDLVSMRNRCRNVSRGARIDVVAHPFTIVDVFTDVALAGNQLAVFTAGELVPDSLLQAVAREMGFSETVFVYPGDRIRIFTPG